MRLQGPGMNWHNTIEEAMMAMQEVEQTVKEDQGEEMVEAGYRDLVYVVAEQCAPSIRNEFLRRHGFGNLQEDNSG